MRTEECPKGIDSAVLKAWIRTAINGREARPLASIGR